MTPRHTYFVSAAGYPFDIPPLGASLTAFCTLAYHLPLIIAFSVAERATFVWGGSMLLRRSALQPCDRHGILQVRSLHSEGSLMMSCTITSSPFRSVLCRSESGPHDAVFGGGRIDRFDRTVV